MFKQKCIVYILYSALIFSPIACAHEAKTLSIQIQGNQAKSLFNYLNGTKIKNDAAAGHQYKNSRFVSCQYIDVDMDDIKGHALSAQDPQRYRCILKFNANGNE